MNDIYRYIGLMFLLVLAGVVALHVVVPLLPFIAFGLICLMIAHKVSSRLKRW